MDYEGQLDMKPAESTASGAAWAHADVESLAAEVLHAHHQRHCWLEPYAHFTIEKCVSKKVQQGIRDAWEGDEHEANPS